MVEIKARPSQAGSGQTLMPGLACQYDFIDPLERAFELFTGEKPDISEMLPVLMAPAKGV